MLCQLASARRSAATEPGINYDVAQPAGKTGHCLTCWQWPVAKHLEEVKGVRRAPGSKSFISLVWSPASSQSGSGHQHD